MVRKGCLASVAAVWAVGLCAVPVHVAVGNPGRPGQRLYDGPCPIIYTCECGSWSKDTVEAVGNAVPVSCAQDVLHCCWGCYCMRPPGSLEEGHTFTFLL